MATTKLSRHSDEPRLDKDGKPVIVDPNERDLKDLFAPFAIYRRLRPDTLALLCGRNIDRVQRRMKALTRQPNAYFRIPDEHYRQPFPNSRRQVYEPTLKGEAFLREEGLLHERALGDDKLFEHAMLIIDTVTSIHLGAMGAGAKMVWWHDIERSPGFPQSTRELEGYARALPVKVSHNGQTVDYHYTNDTHGPFGVEVSPGKYRFLSLEAENKAYLDRSDLSKPSFLKKFLSMQEIERGKLYAHLWGLPNLLHLVVCPDQAAIDRRIELVMRLTGGKGSRIVAFAKMPVMGNVAEAPKPKPELYTMGWQRAGHPDVHLNDPLK